MKPSPTASADPFNLRDQSARGWVERAEICADLVSGLVEQHRRRLRLADLGCGDTKLCQLLDARGLDVDYVGFDLMPQHTEVRQLDLARVDPPTGFDITVMLGVGEYLPNLRQILRRIGASSRWLVFSHVLRTDPPISAARLAQLGWINHLGVEALEALVAEAGLRVVERRLTPDGRTLVLSCAAPEPAQLTAALP
jgi:SAM-dependent methyltransferase